MQNEERELEDELEVAHRVWAAQREETRSLDTELQALRSVKQRMFISLVVVFKLIEHCRLIYNCTRPVFVYRASAAVWRL